jgi:anti-sigma regulatory factor (Ser/Thr protein kinase)
MINTTNQRVRYISYNNTIKFPTKIGSSIVPEFCAAIKEWSKKRPYDIVTLDFQATSSPYSNGMLPIIATISDLREQGHNFNLILPNDLNVSKFFISTNWAHFLSPDRYFKINSQNTKHSITKQFQDFSEIPSIIKEFMDVVISTIRIPKDILSALEWSVNEICDNVINHSQSKIGGFIEITVFTVKEQISFTISDAGKGILNTLKEALPELRTDIQAIGEAIKAGVTRNKEVGQGNGLAGSLRITTMSNGSIEIISGTGRFYTTKDNNNKLEFFNAQNYKGTSVSGNIRLNKSFSISKALDFGGPFPYTPYNVIDAYYEKEDSDCLGLSMKNETTGLGTRKSGKQLHTKTLNLIESKNGYPVIIDWEGVPVVASSFADEFMGKLFIEMGPLSFSSLIRNINMEPLVKQLLDKAISQRLNQEKDN